MIIFKLEYILLINCFYQLQFTFFQTILLHFIYFHQSNSITITILINKNIKIIYFLFVSKIFDPQHSFLRYVYFFLSVPNYFELLTYIINFATSQINELLFVTFFQLIVLFHRSRKNFIHSTFRPNVSW